MRIIADHFRRCAHALRFAIGLHGAEKFHPIVKNKHYHISSGARASLEKKEYFFFLQASKGSNEEASKTKNVLQQTGCQS